MYASFSADVRTRRLDFVHELPEIVHVTGPAASGKRWRYSAVCFLK
jgi:hypothetical protein